MKKTIIFTSVAIATLFAFSSCQKEGIESKVSDSDVRVITAEFENNATKTTLDEDGKTPEWEVGDVIRVLNVSNYQDVEIINGSGDTPESGKAYISGSGLKIGIPGTMTGTLYAVYPASATTMTSCDGSINFSIPAIQDGTFASANICVAKGDDKDNLVFRNATAVLKITTAGDVVGVDITAANNIAGPVTASFEGTTLNLTTSSLDKTSVSAVCKSAPSDNVFYLAAAPGSTGSTTATCYKIDKEGSTSKGSKELQRNVIYSMDLSSMTINTDCDLTGTTGTLNGHEFVIIKAKYDGTNYSYLKWATMNIGATSADEAGTYFAWGDVVGQTWIPLTGGVAAHWSGSGFITAPTLDPANPSVLPLSYDAANVNWGGSWRMPTKEEFDALISLRKGTFDSGYHFGGDTEDAQIFLPIAGFGGNTSLYSATSEGYYWSSSRRPDNTDQAYYVYFSRYAYPQLNGRNRSYGCSVRPVSD